MPPAALSSGSHRVRQVRSNSRVVDAHSPHGKVLFNVVDGGGRILPVRKDESRWPSTRPPSPLREFRQGRKDSRRSQRCRFQLLHPCCSLMLGCRKRLLSAVDVLESGPLGVMPRRDVKGLLMPIATGFSCAVVSLSAIKSLPLVVLDSRDSDQGSFAMR